MRICINLLFNYLMEKLLTLEQLKFMLSDKKLHVVAKSTGLSYPTIKRLADGKCDRFNLKTITALSDYFVNQARTILN